MLIKYIAEEVSEIQIQWGGNTNPSGLLVVGQDYELDYADVRSQSTRIFLKDFPGKQFNSVWFDIEDVNKLPPPGPSEEEKVRWIRNVTRTLYGKTYTEHVKSSKEQFYQAFEEQWAELVYSGKSTLEEYNSSWKKCFAGECQVATLAAAELFDTLRNKYGEECVKAIVVQFFEDIYAAVAFPPTPNHLNDRAHVALRKHRSGVVQ